MSLADVDNVGCGGWDLYHVYQDAFRLGDPTDEVEQDSGVHVGLVTKSAAPGAAATAADQEEIIDVPGIAPGQLLVTAGHCCMQCYTCNAVVVHMQCNAIATHAMQCHYCMQCYT